MGIFRTRGQGAAVDAVRTFVAQGMAQTLLLVGPASVGKTTLALDIAAALLCEAPDPAERPCRTCRGCRLVESGNHPDLHRLAPEGPGGQVRIEPVRELISDLALRPAEGGARVAVIERAHRLNEDAQNALLKTLEEPSAGVTLVLAVDDEDVLLPTVRSRAARLRLGPVAPNAIGDLLVETAGIDRPQATRLARIADGKPGLALTYAAATDAIAIRQELSRALVDLLAATHAKRLVAVRGHLKRATELARALFGPIDGGEPAGRGTGRGRGRRAQTQASALAPIAAPATGPASSSEESEPDEVDGAPAKRQTAADRRRAALTLIDVWRDTARDLLLIQLGEPGGLREPDLLEEYRAAAPRIARPMLAGFLVRLDRVAAQVEGNAYPELAVDVLSLAVPHLAAEAA